MGFLALIQLTQVLLTTTVGVVILKTLGVMGACVLAAWHGYWLMSHGYSMAPPGGHVQPSSSPSEQP
jgi:hypothetical protein